MKAKQRKIAQQEAKFAAQQELLESSSLDNATAVTAPTTPPNTTETLVSVGTAVRTAPRRFPAKQVADEVDSFNSTPVASAPSSATATASATAVPPLKGKQRFEEGDEDQDWRLLVLEKLGQLHGAPSQVVMEPTGNMTLKYN